MEQPTEVILAQAGFGRGLLEIQRRGMIRVDEFDGPLDTKMGQRGLVDGKGVAPLLGGSLGHDRMHPLSVSDGLGIVQDRVSYMPMDCLPESRRRQPPHAQYVAQYAQYVALLAKDVALFLSGGYERYLTVLGRGLPGEVLKLAFEVAEGPEPDPYGDPRKRQIRSLLQELLRLFNSDPGEVVLVRHANGAMEQPTEVILAQAGFGRGLLEIQRRGMMPVDEFDGPLDANMGQRGLVRRKGVAPLSGGSLGHDPTSPLFVSDCP